MSRRGRHVLVFYITLFMSVSYGLNVQNCSEDGDCLYDHCMNLSGHDPKAPRCIPDPMDRNWLYCQKSKTYISWTETFGYEKTDWSPCPSIPCKTGEVKIAIDGGERCEACSAGKYIPEKSTENTCYQCIPGKYQPLPAQAKCVDCPDGTYTTGSGEISPEKCRAQCPPAFMSNQPEYSEWMKPDFRCGPGEYLRGFKTASDKDCRPCPGDMIGRNGLYCERCKGPLEEPHWLDKASCVCKPPAVMNESEACVCQDGMGLGVFTVPEVLMKVYDTEYWRMVMPDPSSLTLIGQANVLNINFPDESALRAALPVFPDDNYAVTFDMRISVFNTGIYTFCTYSEEKSGLWIDGTQVVDNPGIREWPKKCGVASVLKGVHAVLASFFDNSGTALFIVTWAGPDTSFEEKILTTDASPERKCMPCPLNTYGQGGQCWPCAAGNTTGGMIGAKNCKPCEFGKYRLSSQDECQSCSPLGWYAPDPAVAVCVQCNTSCTQAPGWRTQGKCPGDTTARYRLCEPCPGGLPENAVWLSPRSDLLFQECAFECKKGFFHREGQCAACSNATACADPGYQLTPCSPLADSHCEVPCRNDTKPPFNSKWLPGCQWGCEDGYELEVGDYWMFVVYECRPSL